MNSAVLDTVLDTSTHIDQEGDFQRQSWESPNSRLPEHREMVGDGIVARHRSKVCRRIGSFTVFLNPKCSMYRFVPNI